MIKNKQMLFTDFPKIRKITPSVKQANKKRLFIGEIRIGNGMYRTDEETSAYRQNALKRRLP